MNRVIAEQHRVLLVRIMLVAVLSVGAAVAAFAQSESNIGAHRIQFAHGRATAVIRGVTSDTGFAEYVISARAGQQMTVRISSKGRTANFELFTGSDEKPVPLFKEGGYARQWSGRLPRSGDYFISIGSRPLESNLPYKLVVTIR